MLSLDKLKGVIPDNVIAQLSSPNDPDKLGLTSDLRLVHFLAQCSHESGDFKLVHENLNYSADGLVKVFPKYFTADIAPSYARQPEKIANRVYANRMGNGDEASGEGWKYSGKGYIQLTGKYMYQKFTDFIGEDCVSTPSLVETKYPLASAAFFFTLNKLWAICDEGSDDDTVVKVGKRVNGGLLGEADRLARFTKFAGLLGVA